MLNNKDKKRRWGDRRDARWVRDVPGLQTVMAHLMPNRTDSEVYLNYDIDATELMKFIAAKNEAHPDYKTTIFHCFILAVARMIYERPLMNRFIQGRRTYQRNDIILSFLCKRRFEDHAEEALMTFVAHEDDVIDGFSRKVAGEVSATKESEHSTGGIDATLDAFAKMPRLLLMLVVRIIRWLDFWGLVPKALTEGDTNYSTVLFSNLGSIKCPAVYHHLNNYGTNSIMITIGELHKEELLQPDGTKAVRDVINIGATLDERIADGFYFARSLKLVNYIFAHPELLDRPLGESSGFEY